MDQHAHAMDLFGDEERPPLIIERDDHLTGTHDGTVCVHAGASLVISGKQRGTTTFRTGSSGTVTGAILGTLHLASGAVVAIEGTLSGSVHVERGAVLRVEPGGKLAGSLRVDGLVENRGTRGGAVSGTGDVHDVDGGQVKQPRTVDGMQLFDW